MTLGELLDEAPLVATQLRPKLKEPRTQLNVRLTERQLKDLQQRAKKHKMTVSHYLLAVGLGIVDADTLIDGLVERLNGFEDRLERLERYQSLGG